MSTRTLAVTISGAPVYVSGTVNGEEAVWTNTGGNEWEAVAERTADDIYRVELTEINSAGTVNHQAVTLYYGLHLITDRSQTDVDYWQALRSKGWSGMTAAERAEWLAGLKGAYNASDLNRVGAAAEYAAGRLGNTGYGVSVSPKTDWTLADIPTKEELERYLAQISTVRAGLQSVLTAYAAQMRFDMPEVPEDLYGLTFSEANDIERILKAVCDQLQYMGDRFYWYNSGDVYAGEV